MFPQPQIFLKLLSDLLATANVNDVARQQLSPSVFHAFRWPAPKFNPLLEPACDVASVCGVQISWIDRIGVSDDFRFQAQSVKATCKAEWSRILSDRQQRRILGGECTPTIATAFKMIRFSPWGLQIHHLISRT